MATGGVNVDILKCRKCHEFLKIPKNLPCSHMFCRTCLKEEIDRTGPSKFQCPVCNTECPFPAEIDNTINVNNLPTNYFIEVLLKRKSVISGTTLCDQCEKKEVGKCDSLKADDTKTAINWCLVCEEGLCVDCIETHENNKFLNSHKMVNIVEVNQNKFPISVDQFCSQHTERIDHFCADHFQSCCSICVSTLHEKCTKVTTLDVAARNYRKTNDLEVFVQSLNDDIKGVRENIKDGENTMRRLEDDRTGARKMLESLREDIIKHLGELELKMEQEYDVLHNKEYTRVKTKTDNFIKINKILSNAEKLTSTLMNNASDSYIFVEKDKLRKQVEEQQSIITELMAEPYRMEYKIKVAPELESLTTSVQSFGTIEHLRLSSVQQNVGDFCDVPNDSWSLGTRDYNLQEIKTFTAGNCDVGNTHGVQIFHDGKVLLTDYQEESLVLFDNTGKLQNRVQIPGIPCDVTSINETEVAVTYHIMLGPCCVCILDITTLSIKEENLIRGRNYYGVVGIVSNGDRLVIACEDKIVIMDKLGTILKEIKTPPPKSIYRYITVTSNRQICYTNPADGYETANPDVEQGATNSAAEQGQGSVLCINLDGTVEFTYKHKDLWDPSGVTSDGEGFIYVSGFQSNNVHQIAPDGSLFKIILVKPGWSFLGSAGTVINPLALNFDVTNEKLILTHSQSKISIYKLVKSQKMVPTK